MQPHPNFLAAYCERMGSPLFWAEPLNALTNAAFLLVAGFILVHWLRKFPRDYPVLVLMLILTMIGVGSFMFHTIPNRITVMMDVIPILAFIMLSFGLALRRLFNVPRCVMLVGPILLLLVSIGVVAMFGMRAMGGGVAYMPALITLFGLAFTPTLATLFGLSFALRLKAMAFFSRRFALAGALFALSLTLRTLDKPLCGFWPYGLHFLWHVLNAGVLLIVTLTLLQAGREAKRL